MASERIGLEMYLYRNTATYGSPTWVLVEAIRDLTTTLQKATADFSTRGTGKWRAKRGALRDFDVEFEMVADYADVDFVALQDAFLNDTQLDLMLLNGTSATSGAKGWRIQAEVLKFSGKEPLEGAVMVDVGMSVCYDPDHPPTQVTI